MKQALAVTFVITLFSAHVILAQAPPQMPKPGPEHKKLGYFVGKWTAAGEMKQSPFGPAGKFTFTENNEWLPGGFFVVMHSDGKSPMGEMKGLAVMGYKTDEKVYEYHAFNNMGMTEVSTGSVQANTWTWMSESKIDGKPMKSRFIIKELSPTSYTFQWESSADGAAWSTIMEGKSTKMK